MKVLHLLASKRFSGAENTACQIIKLFDNAEMCYCSPDGQIAQTLKEKEIRFIPLEKLSFKNVKKGC